MAIASPNTDTPVTVTGTNQSYGAPLATVTTLFFMWGFLTCLNDILVPHLKSIFDLNYTKVMLIQFAFFGAYFIFSIPSAKVIDWITALKGGPIRMLIDDKQVQPDLFDERNLFEFIHPNFPGERLIACR